MHKRKLIKRLTVTTLCMILTLGAKEGLKVYAAENTETIDTSQSDLIDENTLNMTQAATALGGQYDAATNTITLNSDITLTENVNINNSQALTIYMNGNTISGASITINNSQNADVVFQGSGSINDCQIIKWGGGKLTLDGDIEYYHSKENILVLREGTTVIKKGTFNESEKYILWSDFDWDSGDSFLYIKGGTFNGNILLSNTESYINSGTIDGKVEIIRGKLYVKGATINKGICNIAGDEGIASIIISGGKILDQIVLDNGYGGNLEIKGGTIQSNKEAVIESNVFEGEDYSHSNIKVTGGKIISKKKNGYGIKAINSEIEVTGGTIQNTKKTGKAAIYSVRYFTSRKNAKVNNKVSVKGFKDIVVSYYKKNYCGKDVKYSLDKNGTLTIYGKGEMFAFDFATTNDGKYKDKIKMLVVKEGVTSINGLSNCTKLKSVTLPASLKTIETNTFYECTALEKITMKSGLEKIGHYAFMYARALKEINMPDTVTEIGDQAFYSCVELQKVHFSKKLKKLSSSAFQYCSKLKSVTIPNGIIEIPYGAFYGCKKLSSAKLPAKLKKIDATAFINCTSLKEIEIPATVKEIGRSAFKNCKKLEKVKIQITDDMIIDKSAFDNTPVKDTIFDN